MKPEGYCSVKSWWLNHAIPRISRKGGRLVLCGKAICDIAPSGSLYLEDDLIIGANLRKGSRAESYLKVKEHGTLTVTGRFQVFFGASLEVFPYGKLTLGRGYINTGAAIACAHSITLGDGVFVARNAYITDSDHHQFFDEDGAQCNHPQAVHIGNHVLIGFGAIILKGVTIGDGAAIAAGAVVTRDVPSGCLAAGVPAVVIKEGIKWK